VGEYEAFGCEPLGGAEGLLEAVSFKKVTTESMGREKVINVRWE